MGELPPLQPIQRRGSSGVPLPHGRLEIPVAAQALVVIRLQPIPACSVLLHSTVRRALGFPSEVIANSQGQALAGVRL